MSWWWWGAVALCACALANEDKRAEMSPLPFVLGSRYGRSPPAPRLLAPRNDRFFMGSRYGKRSEPGESESRPGLAGPAGLARLAGGAGGAAGAGGAGGARARLLCEYTGVAALFRCERPPLYDTRRGSDEGDED